jgi:hypothetical protein
MDGNNDNGAVERGAAERSDLSLLKRIPLTKEYAPRVEWLWNQLKGQDYAFDDTTRGVSQMWVNSLADPRSEHYEFGDDGYVVANGITPRCNANVHFAIWGKRTVPEVLEAGRELLEHLFSTYDLNRITAMAPVNNKPASRIAILLRFKYEGELRKAFLFHSIYYNVSLYGLLREEFYKAERVQ